MISRYILYRNILYKVIVEIASVTDLYAVKAYMT
jgi:hypothetical protein